MILTPACAGTSGVPSTEASVLESSIRDAAGAACLEVVALPASVVAEWVPGSILNCAAWTLLDTLARQAEIWIPHPEEGEESPSPALGLPGGGWADAQNEGIWVDFYFERDLRCLRDAEEFMLGLGAEKGSFQPTDADVWTYLAAIAQVGTHPQIRIVYLSQYSTIHTQGRCCLVVPGGACPYPRMTFLTTDNTVQQSPCPCGIGVILGKIKMRKRP